MTRLFIIFVLCVSCITLATSRLRVPQGRVSGMDRLKEPEIEKCLRSKYCIITDDLSLICGSDGRTYPNKGTIDCLNECLKPEEKVTTASHGYCMNDIIPSR